MLLVTWLELLTIDVDNDGTDVVADGDGTDVVVGL